MMNQHRIGKSSSVVDVSDRNQVNASRQQQRHPPKPAAEEARNSKIIVSKKILQAPSLDPTKHQSEYGQMGRPSPEKPMKRPANDDNFNVQARHLYENKPLNGRASSNLPTVGDPHRLSTQSKISIETSDECNQVAEEDQSNYIKIRNQFLDDDLDDHTAKSSFKQEPKQGKIARLNPNLYQMPQTVMTLHQLTQSPLLPINQGQQPINLNSNRRIFDTAKAKQMNQQPALVQVPVRHSSHGPQPAGPQPTLDSQNPSKNGARRIVSSSGKHSEVPSGDRFRASTQTGVIQTTKLGPNGIEEGVNSARKPHPMFQRMQMEEPANGIKQAMIHQFEMNCGPKNGMAAQVYQNHEITGQSGSMNHLMNKATLCDSTASQKQNMTAGSNSQFLRKSLWLLTNSKSLALRDLVQQRQATCGMCHYIHSYQQLTIAANAGIQSAHKPVLNSTIFQTSQMKNVKSPSAENYFSMSSGPEQQQSLNRMLVTHQMQNIEPKTKLGQASKLLATDGSHPQTQTSKHQQFQTMPPEIGPALGFGVTNSRINLKIKSPRSPGSPGTPNSQSQEPYLSGRRQIRRINNYQVASQLSNSHGSGTGYILAENVHISTGLDGAVAHELFDRFEGQCFTYMLKKSLIAKYMTSQEYYNSKVSSDIMYNEQRHIVSVFKEYLIYDDFSEYLKRFYNRRESIERLPRVFEFYDNYSKVFPNYVSLPESKYMFKNIERKQKLIDQKHQNFLRNQKKEKGDLSVSKNSMLVLFNSKFLKEVYDEPTLHGSMMLPREEISINAMSKVFNQPPVNKVINLSQSLAKLDISRNHRELENIINLLSRFDRNEENTIMAREVISDSLFKTKMPDVAPIYLNDLGHRARINTEANDLSMSSWTMRSNRDFKRQESDFILTSEADDKSFLFIDKQTPKIAVGFSRQKSENKIEPKPILSKKEAQNAASNAKLNPVKDFLNELLEVPDFKPKQAQLNERQIITRTSQPIQLEPSQFTRGELTRNQEFGVQAYTQQQQTGTSSVSTLTAPAFRPGMTSAAVVRESIAQKGMPRHDSRTRLPPAEEVKVLSEQSMMLQSQNTETFQKNIKNLMLRDTNTVVNGSKKLKEQYHKKAETHLGSVEKVKIGGLIDRRSSSNNAISRNGAGEPHTSADPMKRSNLRMSRTDKLIKVEAKQDQTLEKLTHGSRSSIVGPNSQQAQLKVIHNAVKQKLLEDQLKKTNSDMRNMVQVLMVDDGRFKTSEYPENRKVKTTLDNYKTEQKRADTSNRNVMKIEPPSNYGTTKIARAAISSLSGAQQHKPVIERKKIVVKKSLESLTSQQPNVMNSVYQILGKAKPHQMTPNELLGYYTRNTEHTDSQKNLHNAQAFPSPDVKERTSKSETAHKDVYRVAEEHKWTEQKVTNRTAFKKSNQEKVDYVASSYQTNPYEKTGRMNSAMSRASDNSSGKGSARIASKLIELKSNGQNSTKKVVTVKMNAASASKPPGTISLASIQRLGAGSQVLNSLPSNGGTIISTNSGSSSNYSQKIIGSQLYVAMQTSEANLFAMAKKTTAMMKKGPLSSGSSKTKKKQTTATTNGKTAVKLPSKKVKNILASTQGQTIFAINPKPNA